MGSEIPAPPSDFTVIPSKDGIFEEVWSPLLKLKSLAIPVSAQSGAPEGFISIAGQMSGNGRLAPVYSDLRLTEARTVSLPTLYLLTGLFEIPGFRGIIFNPPGRYSSFSKTLERENWSLLIGCLESGAMPADPLNRSLSEFNSGRLHAAHYCLWLLPDRPDFQPHKLLLAKILVQLGLYAKAGETMRDYFQKNPRTARSLFLMAEISRKSGNLQQAGSWSEQAGAALRESGLSSPADTVEPGWLELESGDLQEAEKFFRQNLENPVCRQEAALGLGTALKDTGLKNSDKSRLTEASSFLKKAALLEGPIKAQALFQLGIVLMRLSDLDGAEDCYRKSLALRPSLIVKVNLGFTLLMRKKTAEATELCREICLFDRDSAAGLISRLTSGEPPSAPAGARDNTAPAGIRPQPVPPAAGITPAVNNARPPAGPAVGFSAKPPTPEIIKKTPAPPAENFSRPAPGAGDAPVQASVQDGFLSRAYTLVSALKEELRRDIGFTPEGLREVENKLRLSFLKAGNSPAQARELILNSAAFLCQCLQQRYKGNLHRFPDMEEWTWLMTFENSPFATFPVERCWQFLRSGELPEPGWLTKYAEYVGSEVRKADLAPVAGAEAVKRGLKSSPHCITDAETDHKRVMLLLRELQETKNMNCDRSGVPQLEKALKSGFSPGPQPPDKWRLLRCYGHILVEIMTVEFRAAWFNTDGGDGLWSMRLPWGVFVFPFGKIYRTALQGGSLSDYYVKLEAGKTGPPGPVG